VDHIKFMRMIGSRGGAAGKGATKARTREQCQKAARARWDKYRKEKGGKKCS